MGKGYAWVGTAEVDIAGADTVAAVIVLVLVGMADAEVRASILASTRDFARIHKANSYPPGVYVLAPLYCFQNCPDIGMVASRGSLGFVAIRKHAAGIRTREG